MGDTAAHVLDRLNRWTSRIPSPVALPVIGAAVGALRGRSAKPPDAGPAVAAGTLRALTLNIGAAAPLRAAAILRWLVPRSDDVIVLTETSSGAGTRLLIDGLEQRGYHVHARMDARDRGVLVATRVKVAATLDASLDVTLPWRVSGLLLDTSPKVTVVGVYVPSRDRSALKVARKEAFLESLLESVGAQPDAVRRHLLLVGDYNVVRRDHSPRIPGFFSYEYDFHDRLESFGLTAAHELVPRREQPHSWMGRTGTGYLYDYVHVGSALHSRVARCAYLHGPRERRLSDHAAVSVRLRLSTGHGADEGGVERG